MKLGILSDSHGRIERLRQAVAVLDREGCQAFAHCGDVGSIELLDELAGRPCWFVWGNTDDPHPAWRAGVEAMGIAWPGDPPCEIVLSGKRLAVFHGHEPAFHKALALPRYNYLLHGHTHERADYYIGGMRVINPGALHRVGVPTVASLDLVANHLRFFDLQGRPVADP